MRENLADGRCSGEKQERVKENAKGGYARTVQRYSSASTKQVVVVASAGCALQCTLKCGRAAKAVLKQLKRFPLEEGCAFTTVGSARR